VAVSVVNLQLLIKLTYSQNSFSDVSEYRGLAS
jgi:hypothetical protein